MISVSSSRVALAAGAAAAFVVIGSPAVSTDADAVTSGVLPLGFFAAGAVAHVLRPGHLVGLRLLQVGTLHLVAIAVAVVVAALVENGWAASLLGMFSASAYVVGFVALLDLLARYPTGHYAWPWVRRLVRVVTAGALALVGVSALAQPHALSVLELPGPENPLHVPALAPLGMAVAAVLLAPVLGAGLLLARFPRASQEDRTQMRWPAVTALVIAVLLLTSGLAEAALGPSVQTAVFVTAGAALPASFLVGLLRHSEEAERLKAAEASRSRLAAVADAERRRIERDLHDGAQQQLIALLARVELARSQLGEADGEVARELGEIGSDIRDVHHDLRELARGIHPAILTDRGLAEAVRSAASRLPLKAALEVAPDVDSARYRHAIEGAAYMFALEGMTNAMKHAGTRRVRISLSVRDDVLQVVVTDDGRGFDVPSTGELGSGLTGLRDRLAAVGATLEIDSRPGAGTSLRGAFPVGTHDG